VGAQSPAPAPRNQGDRHASRQPDQQQRHHGEDGKKRER
jgi:hypothetical protein